MMNFNIHTWDLEFLKLCSVLGIKTNYRVLNYLILLYYSGSRSSRQLTYSPCFALHRSRLRDQPVQLTLSREEVQKPFPKPPEDGLDVKKQGMHLAALA